MKKRILLAKARAAWAYNIELWSNQMRCYNICLASDLPLSYAEYYLDNASSLRADAEATSEQFGDVAKRKPTFFDKLLLVCFGWSIKLAKKKRAANAARDYNPQCNVSGTTCCRSFFLAIRTFTE